MPRKKKVKKKLTSNKTKEELLEFIVDLQEQLKNAKEHNDYMIIEVKKWIEKVKLEGKERAVWESKFVRLEDKYIKLKSEIEWLKGENKK
ncbi:hypothetical protein [Oceanihabitans sediminis]|uniref:hypothetical protein n=1 Tax=Oceanihabitans sediminis TaxID=1812012 RepID=UPI00299F128D|nr:hypothetical protein [Oceanihabitans sediminis]MDX1279021.1 hypothetical protein [Oceanihabitans sediminis]